MKIKCLFSILLFFCVNLVAQEEELVIAINQPYSISDANSKGDQYIETIDAYSWDQSAVGNTFTFLS